MLTKRLLFPCSKDAQSSVYAGSCHNVAPGPFAHSLLALSDPSRWDLRVWPSRCCFWATLSPRSCVRAGPGWDALVTMQRILSAGGHCLPFFFFFISWKLITLQYYSGFRHTLTWISHGYTCIPHPNPLSHLPLHPIPLGLPSAPGPGTCLMHPTWAGDLFHPR